MNKVEKITAAGLLATASLLPVKAQADNNLDCIGRFLNRTPSGQWVLAPDKQHAQKIHIEINPAPGENDITYYTDAPVPTPDKEHTVLKNQIHHIYWGLREYGASPNGIAGAPNSPDNVSVPQCYWPNPETPKEWITPVNKYKEFINTDGKVIQSPINFYYLEVTKPNQG